ncbi:hydrogenase maturation protease [Nodosilinea sp. LEGE 07088]|uniref:hydrogenase maturation protease n=1 Tax=Nodosilinea sp. LEGE 07088 TaxID=2777968 RepID=UPI0028BF3AA3|nr:hydrogenase maturation protease [Nodosilinea sp. LEGE 07088]
MNLKTSSTPAASSCSLLIVGYGNELRGDDGVGPQVAMTVADWHLPSVKSLHVQQLLPELVADMAEADYVIFVDACGKSRTHNVQLDPIVTNKDALAHCTVPLMNHACEPSGLVALTQVLYGDHPQAWLLQVPIEHCGLGQALSKTARRGADSALRTIEQFFTTYLRQPFAGAEPCMKSA